MTSANDPQWEAIIRNWAHAYTLSHDPRAAPDQRYSARPLGTEETLHAETPAGLLDAIKDHAAARLSTRQEAP